MTLVEHISHMCRVIEAELINQDKERGQRSDHDNAFGQQIQ